MAHKKDKIAELHDEILLRTVAEIEEETAVKVFRNFRNSEIVYERPDLDRKLQALLKTHKRKNRTNAFLAVAKRAAKRVAILFIVMISTCGVLFVSAEAFRVRVLNLFVHEETLYQNVGSIADNEELKAMGVRYIPDYLPDGFYKSGLAGDSNIKQIHYSNKDGDTIIFEQSDRNQLMSLDTEHELKRILIGEYEGYIVSDTEGQTVIMWEQDTLFFGIFGDIPVDAAKRMAESLVSL